MLILMHQHNRLVSVVDEHLNAVSTSATGSLAAVMRTVAKEHPKQWILWCRKEYMPYLQKDAFATVFHHHRIMASYAVSLTSYLPPGIGFIENTPFVTVKKEVSYPTWMMSSDVGGIYASVVQTLPEALFSIPHFDYFLNSVAKKAMPQGLLCYSDPSLLNTAVVTEASSKAGNLQLFQFVYQHYKTRWMFLLLFNMLLFQKKLPLFSFFAAFFRKKLTCLSVDMSSVEVRSGKKEMLSNEMDVIIPTIGRAAYLHDVLKDLAAQSLLPKKVIIIEQDPDLQAKSELEYLTTTAWPFTIVHRFIHQTGACNARNLALKETTAPWVFFADDDNRLPADTLEKSLAYIKQWGIEVLTSSYLQKGELKVAQVVKQWATFGAGNTFVAGALARAVTFNSAYEHGYGEDVDYGMQLRKRGVDILYHPDINILHLKAPMGGFRKPVPKAWEQEEVQPKPSPTIQLVMMQHRTVEQRQGYQLLLFLKFYFKQPIKNPVAYLQVMKKRWKSSVYWANQLQNR